MHLGPRLSRRIFNRMKQLIEVVAFVGCLALIDCALVAACAQTTPQSKAGSPYLGFDRNDYPGDTTLPTLRKTFSYTSYWLNNPPAEIANSWAGKRAILRENGFGFLVLFTGRTDAQIKVAASRGGSAGQLGAQDGKAAVAGAVSEGFPKNVLIFLDQEEGGRLLQEQAAYLFAWADAVQAGGARPGVYCSGIDVREGTGTISTAQDIAERQNTRADAKSLPGGKTMEHPIALWIANDQCPPAPGCSLMAPRLDAGVQESLRRFVTVWQYAQSPRRAQFSTNCPQNQAPDGNCYLPGDRKILVDLDTADSPDPSE